MRIMKLRNNSAAHVHRPSYNYSVELRPINKLLNNYHKIAQR